MGFRSLLALFLIALGPLCAYVSEHQPLHGSGQSSICLRESYERDVLVIYPPVDLSQWSVSGTNQKYHNIMERTGRPLDGSPQGFVVRWIPFIRGRSNQLNVDHAFSDFKAEFPNGKVSNWHKSDNYLYGEIVDATNNKAAAFGFQRGRRGWFQMVYYQFGHTPSNMRDRWLQSFEEANIHRFEKADHASGEIPCPLNPQPPALAPPPASPPETIPGNTLPISTRKDSQ